MQPLDDVSVYLARPVYVSELKELFALVPEDWEPVLQRSAVGESELWLGGADGNLKAPPLPWRLWLRTLPWSTIIYGAVGTLIIGSTIWAGNEYRKSAAQRRAYLEYKKPSSLPPNCWEMGPATALGVNPLWKVGESLPTEPCDSGVLYCQKMSFFWNCHQFGSPWPDPFLGAWHSATRSRPLPFDKCAVFCRTPDEVNSALGRRLLKHFPLPDQSSISPEEQVQRVVASLIRNPKCSGTGVSWREINNLHDCHCDVAHVTCEVVVNSDQTTHNVTLTDFGEPLPTVSGSFAEYPEQEYSVNNCSHECYNRSTA
ncbi:putative transmembrane protein [Gregarina niphandrodes]|uniref:Transmembrane protein n=1 Tax=Gregarina niphandrodes TaxID=110365 RepID=A0A023AZ98_GRENI|nr:putative transmembrane protein [Gregarina niphandrodes]EZG44024.1 putative transmembrane protein [Gregarina niphandrodes]|eukprot:XP_011132841.1 putative transmembrane protein [Gregarina niphandrodes]